MIVTDVHADRVVAYIGPGHEPYRLAGRLRRELAPHPVAVSLELGSYTASIVVLCEDPADAILTRARAARLLAGDPPPFRRGNR